MNIDCDLLGEIGELRLGDRPLLVSDVDEVVFEFVTPFSSFLKSNGFALLPRSFQLFGNIVTVEGMEIGRQQVTDLLDVFFNDQKLWQTPALDAVETLNALSEDFDIVFLTAMKPRHRELRRAALDHFGLRFSLIATEAPKGAVVRHLHRERPLPVVFIDDIDRNLHSVREEVPSCLLLRMMANEEFRMLAPPAAHDIRVVSGWRDAQEHIRAHCGVRLSQSTGQAKAS